MRIVAVFSVFLMTTLGGMRGGEAERRNLEGLGSQSMESEASDPGETDTVPLGVTLEACGDVNADEVRRALEIEYRGGLVGTMVTIVCADDSATISIVGPENPRGRIASINFTGVSDIAIPRTIAIFASELWTAPEADPAVQVAAVETVSKPASENAAVEVGRANDIPSLRESYRRGVSFGFGLGVEDRQIRGSVESPGLTKEYIGWSLSAEWAAHPRVGLFASFGHGNSSPNEGNDPEQRGIGIYDQGELGAYVPVLSGEWAIDIRLAAGYDKQYQPNVLKLDYEYLEVGADIRYFMRDDLMLTGIWTSQAILATPTHLGSRISVGIALKKSRLLLEGKVSYLDADIQFRNRLYEQSVVKAEIGLRYSY